MPQGYTLEQLKAMGKVSKDYQPPSATTPTETPAPQSKGYTLQELQDMGKVSKSYVPPAPKPAPVVADDRGLGEKVLRGAVDLGIGAVKGAASTVAGGMDLVEKYAVNPALQAIGKAPVETTVFQREGDLAAKGTMQKIGKGGEQIAELLLPGSAPAKVAGATSKALKLAKVAEEAPGLLRAGRALGRTGVRAATEAGVVGGQVALQTGGDEEAVAGAQKSAAMAVPFLKGAGVVGKLGAKALGGTSERIINSLIKPLQRDFAYGKNPGRGVTREGIVANTFDELIDKITDKRKEIGSAIGTVLDQSKGKISLMGVLTPVDEAIAGASKLAATNAPLIARLDAIKADVGALLKKKTVTPREAFELKQIIADATKFTGNASDDAVVNKALKRVYGEIKERINASTKGVAELNERFADIKSAEVAARYRDKIMERQNVLPFGGKTGGVVAGAVMAGAPGAAIGALLGAGVEKIMASTLLKTRLAKMLSNMSGDELNAAKKAYPMLQTILNRLK